ncbi:hypothetical protein H8F21_14825 [Pseudomonas sp. P66]|uniref:Uncharacterized protein n=1 Tax=Pseudomonas arcuscaelestis TaxID=2710591 RepID=A0ABS2BZG7_9PSED|nr:hypothetical protein [Pseudomonas arcuscaelestis]MBM5458840.1 hypothetical protein [Pseudomonas arcuscaelestis]
MKRKTAYELGVFGFGMVAVGLMAPVLLGDESLSKWQFGGLSLAVFLAIFCACKSFPEKEESSSEQS